MQVKDQLTASGDLLKNCQFLRAEFGCVQKFYGSGSTRLHVDVELIQYFKSIEAGE